MWVWGAITVTVVSIIVLIMLSYIKVTVQFKRKGSDDIITYDIRALLGLIRYRVKVPIIQFKGFKQGIDLTAEMIKPSSNQKTGNFDEMFDVDKIKQYVRRFQLLKDHFDGFGAWLHQVITYIHCDQLDWKTRVGIGDAAGTAIATGSVWSVKSTLVGFLCSKIKLKTDPALIVAPQYNKIIFATEGVGVFKMRHCHALKVNISFVYRILKVKGGVRAWYRFLKDMRRSWNLRKAKV